LLVSEEFEDESTASVHELRDMVIGNIVKRSVEFYAQWKITRKTQLNKSVEIEIPEAKILEVVLHGHDLVYFIRTCSEQDLFDSLWMLKIIVAEIPPWMLWYRRRIIEALQEVCMFPYLQKSS
jgi:hypothetical protein